jgi:hypothetical protein
VEVDDYELKIQGQVDGGNIQYSISNLQRTPGIEKPAAERRVENLKPRWFGAGLARLVSLAMSEESSLGCQFTLQEYETGWHQGSQAHEQSCARGFRHDNIVGCIVFLW